MNPNLAKLQPYPFERLRLLFKDITPDPRYPAINLGIGEPKHPAPEFIRQALAQNLSGLASYPASAGTPALREAIAAWARRRYRLTGLDALTQVLPVNGSREALFALAQVVIDPGRGDAVVVCPREASISGARRRSTTNISPARCTANIMLLCCRVATWRALPTAATRVATTCAWPWWRRWPNAWKRHSASMSP